MTLIANTTNYAYPILIGDILSTSETIEQELELPTFLRGVNDLLPGGQSLLPYKLRQKIYVINDYIAVALAGYEYDMKIFLEDFISYFKYREATYINFQDFFATYDLDEVKNCHALILFAELKSEGILIHQKHFGSWKYAPSEGLEHVFTCGSGSDDYLNLATETMIYGHSGDHHPLYRAISLNYIVLSRLLGIERLTLDTIKKYWGAGFEMIYFDGERFKKMDDITYIVWKGKVNLDSEDYDMQPFLIMNFKYYDDILVINSTDGETTKGFGVLPIYMKKEDVDVTKLPTTPSFDSLKVCCTMVLELSNGEVTTPSFFTENTDKPGAVTVYYDDEGRLSIMIQAELQDQIIRNLRQLIN